MTMKWVCMCGRTFHSARKCLRCGDRLPILVKEGRISWDERRRMSVDEYRKWLDLLDRIEEAELEAAIEQAKREILSWEVQGV